MKAVRAHISLFFAGFLLFSLGVGAAQERAENSLPMLFRNNSPLPVELRYSNKEVKRKTNDTIFLQSHIWFRMEEHWDSLPISIRARGNFRRKTCYFAPLKLRFRKAHTQNTVFEGSEKLKLVLPCLLERYSGDYVLREFMAYRLFEVIAPYHFKTRLLQITLYDTRGRREVDHRFFGFFIEDMDYLCLRYGGQKIKRRVHPLQQDDLYSVRNAFFEYMIANTDFSTKHLHNQKLIFAEKRIIPLPYDFDMSGLVNAPYAVVTNIHNLPGSITQVTDRIYKGYERERSVLYQVREEFMQRKPELFRQISDLQGLFEDPAKYRETYNFLLSFFDILEDDKKFEREIVKRLRSR